MVAALLPLHHGFTRIASLPALLLGLSEEPLGLLILGAVRGGMPFAIASHAHLGVATIAACTMSLPVTFDERGFDPFTTLLGRAVHSILGPVFCTLAIPKLFEIIVE